MLSQGIQYNQEFAQAIIDGIFVDPPIQKFIPSKFFYDAKGSKLFEQITELPEYYLTNSERDIFETKGKQLINLIGFEKSYRIIELGAGIPYKTIAFMSQIANSGLDITYYPIDIAYGNKGICNNVKSLVGLINNLGAGLCTTCPIPGESLYHLRQLKKANEVTPCLIMCLGSSIGNLILVDQIEFLQSICQIMNENDRLVVGFDMCADGEIVLKAYNDKQGITAQFNLNLLERINRELGGNFETTKFKHSPEYSYYNRRAVSYIESLQDQRVHIDYLNDSVEFSEGEKIHTEFSHKFSPADIYNLALEAGFKEPQLVFDSSGFFAEAIFTKK